MIGRVYFIRNWEGIGKGWEGVAKESYVEMMGVERWSGGVMEQVKRCKKCSRVKGGGANRIKYMGMHLKEVRNFILFPLFGNILISSIYLSII